MRLIERTRLKASCGSVAPQAARRRVWVHPSGGRTRPIDGTGRACFPERAGRMCDVLVVCDAPIPIDMAPPRYRAGPPTDSDRAVPTAPARRDSDWGGDLRTPDG